MHCLMDPINLYCYSLFRFNCHQFHLDSNFIYWYKIFWYCRVFIALDVDKLTNLALDDQHFETCILCEYYLCNFFKHISSQFTYGDKMTNIALDDWPHWQEIMLSCDAGHWHICPRRTLIFVHMHSHLPAPCTSVEIYM